VDRLWADRLVRYESNVRLHRPAGYGSPRLVDHDPTWPAQAERLAARVRRAAGERALRVDHLGSTAVPGLPAKDVIDLQLAVSTLDDADAVAAPLTEAGFVLLPGIDHDNPRGGDPGPWGKRFHASADPGRPANLHLRVLGGPAWRYALLCRDWLCADAAAREEYLEVKRALAHRFTTDDDTANYTEAKESWFDAAHPRMAEWAERTGWRPPEVNSS
jgi:dephospho-CoA kinase